MAAWVDNAEKRREINQYFASINCMSLRIIEDIQKIQNNFGSSWDKFSLEEQEEKINEYMIPQDVRKQYPLPEEEKPVVFPTLKIDSGQKIVELQIDQSEYPQSWMDEHSDPFSLQSRSQMDLRLPPPSGKRTKKKKSSLEKMNPAGNGAVNSGNHNLLSSLNGGFLNSKSEKIGSTNGSVLGNFGLFTAGTGLTTSGTDDDLNPGISNKYEPQNEPPATAGDFTIPDFGTDINLDFKTDYLDSYEPESYDIPYTASKNSEKVEIRGLEASKPKSKDLPDIRFDGSFFKSHDSAKKNDDYSKIPEPEILPSSGLSKAYDESEFLDLYPQPKKETPKLSKSDNFAKPKETKAKPLKGSKKYEKKAPKLPENPPPKRDAALPTSVLRTKKTHRKKSSSGSNQVNPRSSLTLDGAILNLEIAAEMNKQGMSPQIKHEKVFGDEDDLLKQIEKDTDLESWLTDTPSQGSPLLTSKTEIDDSDSQLQRSGFDFLDNW